MSIAGRTSLVAALCMIFIGLVALFQLDTFAHVILFGLFGLNMLNFILFGGEG